MTSMEESLSLKLEDSISLKSDYKGAIVAPHNDKFDSARMFTPSTIDCRSILGTAPPSPKIKEVIHSHNKTQWYHTAKHYLMENTLKILCRILLM